MNSITLPVRAYKNMQGMWNVRDSNGHKIVSDFQESEANQIALALNCHDALVEAVKFYERTSISDFSVARTALAKVEDLRKNQ